ncbi:MAG: hypothetical protein CR991_08860 [Proteobacteria bacterium]|nr:MAG: hypothetical protein CR991_08860 [Pseudomonadota bacterium]
MDPVPDPFSLDEVEMILEHMRGKYDPQVANYFEFIFFTGLRIEEQIALYWSDVDWNKKYIRIQRAQTAGELKSVKTGQIRDIDLNTRALEALRRQKEHTFLQDKFIFLNPVTGNPWNDNGKAQRKNYWKPSLKKLGIRHRHAYNTRHTYATMLLMANNKPPMQQNNWVTAWLYF